MPPGSAPVQWPGYPNHGHPPQGGQGYHFPPPEPGYGHDQQGHAPPQWGQQADQGGYDLANYLPAEPGPFQHHQQQAYEADADYGEEFYEDEEPRSGRRWFFIAAALVGAIGVGGALAYTYRSIVATDSGRVPLVKAEPTVKVKPDHPGGKEFPGTDRKLPNRSAEAPAEAPGPAAEEKSLGPRPVKTIRIGEPPAAAPPPQVAVVPGITLENFRPPAAAPAPKAEEPAPKVEEPPPEAAKPPPTERVTIGEKPAPAEAADADDPPAPARKRPPPVVASIALPKAAPPPLSSGLGYVAVVSSKRTHIDALKAYADVAQKHPDVLSGKTPDVQEANLGERGIWFRAVVGPPGSREAARSLCSQLKAAGQDCWIKEY